MQDDQFKKRMDDWVEEEVKTAPKLRPTVEMYRLVKLKGEKRPPITFQLRWAHVGVALAGLIILLSTYLTLFTPDSLVNPTPEQLAYIPQREIQISEALWVTMEARPPDKGKGRGADSFEQMAFQVHRGTTNQIETLDLQQKLVSTLNLSHQDSYRLLIKTNQERYLYIYQLRSTDQFQTLHQQLSQNPIPAGTVIYLPDQLNWYYLDEKPGEYKLYVISSAIRLNELEERYNQCIKTTDPDAAPTACTELRYKILTIENSTNTDVEIWQVAFKFKIED
jgi:hypothetical protein